jgi:chloramphenicol-sensitive protein RarD
VNETHKREMSGLLYGLAAYGFWGLMPIYFRAVDHVPNVQVLAHRIVWCALLLGGILSLLGRWPDLRACLRSRRTVLLLSLSSVLVAVNWYAYIYGALTNRIVQTSLGYFMTPLVSVMLGMFFFRERLRLGQWAALALATTGLIYLMAKAGEVPWIALSLATSFGCYGLIRKITPVDGLIGLMIETLLLSPLALALLGWWGAQGVGAFRLDDWLLDGLLVLSGPCTAIPLLCFGHAARRLPLSVLGFLQYISPSMQLVLAVLVYHEDFQRDQQLSFACIWAALAVFSVDALLTRRREPVPETLPVVEEAPV